MIYPASSSSWVHEMGVLKDCKLLMLLEMACKIHSENLLDVLKVAIWHTVD